MGSLVLLHLAGTAALLLWGVRMVQTGVQRAFGPRLQSFLGSALRTRLRAALAGLGVTAALQSSTATALMISRFVADGAVQPVPALAAVLGGGVGTALVVQVLSFDLSHAAWAAVLLGAFLFRRTHAPKVRDLGRTLVGLGLMLLSLRGLVDLAAPLAGSDAGGVVLQVAANRPVLTMLATGALAWAMHSSVAVVLLAMPLATSGVLPPPAALAAVLGANLGTAINPVLEGAGDRRTRCVSIGNLLVRACGCAALLPVLDPAARELLRLDPDPARLVANFHAAFNFLLLAVSLPVLGPLARLVPALLPGAPAEDPGKPLHLSPSELEVPSLALAGARREALRMAGLLDAMLGHALRLREGDWRAVADARGVQAALNALHGALRAYLAALDADALTDEDRQHLRETVMFMVNLDRAGDVLDREVLARLSRGLKHGMPLGPAEADALRDAVLRLRGNLAAATTVFTSGDVFTARDLAAEKQAFRALEADAVAAQVPALRPAGAGGHEPALPMDLLNGLKRVNAHLVASAAHAVLEAEGELLPSRVAAAQEHDAA